MPEDMQQRGDSTWRLQVLVGRDSNGRKQYPSKAFHGTKKRAQMALAALVTGIAQDRAVVSVEQISVSEVLGRWLQTRRKRLSPATIDRYKIAITHVNDSLGKLPVALPDRTTPSVPRSRAGERLEYQSSSPVSRHQRLASMLFRRVDRRATPVRNLVSDELRNDGHTQLERCLGSLRDRHL